MAEIDELTKKSIHENKSLIETISTERIWDEFTKAFKQSKYFSTYLNFISEFDMWSEIFPGAKVTVEDFKETNNLALCLAQIFRNDDVSTIKKELVKSFGAPVKLANKVEFFMNLKTLTPERVKLFVSSRDRAHIEDSEISEWFDISNLKTDVFNAFVGFEPQVNSREVMNDLGIEVNAKGNPKNPRDGQQLGAEINQRIINQFKERI